MAGTLSPILEGIIELLEGAAGVPPRTVPAGRFTHADTRSDQRRPFVQLDAPRPFGFGYPRLIQGPAARGDLTGGSHARVTHEVDLVVFYGTMEREQLAQLQTMADDEALITHTLEYELNVATVDGWEGCIVRSSGPEDLTVDGAHPDESPFRILRLTLELGHREETTP